MFSNLIMLIIISIILLKRTPVERVVLDVPPERLLRALIELAASSFEGICVEPNST